MHPRPNQDIPDFERRLHRWVRAGLISEGEAGAIWSFEIRQVAEPPATAPPSRRVPVVTEVIGYLGTALAGAAAAVFVARSWDDLTQTQRLVVPGLATVVFLVGGFAIHRGAEPAVQRLAGLLWLLAVGGAGWFVGLLAADVANASDRTIVFAVGATVTALSGAIYTYRRWSLPQLAVLVGLGWLVGAAGYDEPLAIGLGLSGLGIAWAILGAFRVLAPHKTAMMVGFVVGLWAPTITLGEWAGLGLVVGTVVAAMAVALGARLHVTVVLGIGVVGLFLYLLGTIPHFLPGSTGTTLGLLGFGIALIALAVIAMRRRPRPGPPGPAHG